MIYTYKNKFIPYQIFIQKVPSNWKENGVLDKYTYGFFNAIIVDDIEYEEIKENEEIKALEDNNKIV